MDTSFDVIMFTVVNDFVDWLMAELNKRGWSNSELARRAEVVPSTVSMVLSQQKHPGLEFCVGVARALGLQPEYVLRKAGLLPPVPQDGDFTPEALADLDQMRRYIATLRPDAQQRVTEQLVALARMAAELSDTDRNENAA